jgi:dynein heavy chain
VPKKLYPEVEKKIPEVIDKKGGLIKNDTFTLKII